MRFEGTDTYVATPDLMLAVNAAIALERPLLVKGEPGTGKTMLAEEVARALSRPLLQWHIKSTTKAQQGLYEYDAVSRLRDSQLGDAHVGDIAHYIKRGVLWEAFEADAPAVVLIDEIDKADIEFPNDLLRELDRMEFYVYETQQTIRARQRPLVVITSNNEKELPDAFLRRCFFHYIRFPDKETMTRIVDVHFPGLKQALLAEALQVFFNLREVSRRITSTGISSRSKTLIACLWPSSSRTKSSTFRLPMARLSRSTTCASTRTRDTSLRNTMSWSSGAATRIAHAAMSGSRETGRFIQLTFRAGSTRMGKPQLSIGTYFQAYALLRRIQPPWNRETVNVI